MRKVKSPDSWIVEMLGNNKNPIYDLKLSKTEKARLIAMEKFLEDLSNQFKKLYSCEPHENPFFRAQVEIGECLVE